jgi:redox-sensitive bicupin YhaK (pirin superfamily)
MERQDRRVTRLVPATETRDGAGVRLKRSIGSPAVDHLDPFLLLDEFSSYDAADYIEGFPDHPHRGMETVTYMLEGAMRHADNHGQGGVLVGGGVQWMTAGRGIVHSEMPEQRKGRLRGFQLWVNLPQREKMRSPRYQNISPDEVPEVEADAGVRVRVIAGRARGVEGAVKGIIADPLYLDIALPAGAAFTQALPAGHGAFVYPFEGQVKIGAGGASQTVPSSTLAILGPGPSVSLAADGEPARALLVAGQPIGEPVVRYGPFVMTTREEIIAAIRDFQAGRF